MLVPRPSAPPPRTILTALSHACRTPPAYLFDIFSRVRVSRVFLIRDNVCIGLLLWDNIDVCEDTEAADISDATEFLDI